MSKEIADILGRMHGDLIALQGMERKLAPPPEAQLTIAEQEGIRMATIPPAKASKEDYEYVKKLVAEIKSLCDNVETLVDKETKAPEAGAPKSMAGAETKK